ncbi:hypothetical protein F5Y15DRAFT_119643 [Xylariaceae sp. FL0016]|nr:hypothetical protein F5Y15DRAFT_119643 [Xylariaceae sp. FL0016]
MAAPANKNIGDLNGKWFLNKTLSDPIDPALQLQGIGWLIRKAIGAASVTLHVTQYSGPPKPPNPSTDPVSHIDIQQVATAGLKGTTENRTIDFVPRDHSDWLFGTVRGQTKWMTGAEVQDLVKEGAEALTKGWVEGGFIAEGWLEGEEEKGGPEGETHVLSFVENIDGSGWTGTQVWGFQTVAGERRYARNVVIGKKGKFVNIRMVYDWVP